MPRYITRAFLPCSILLSSFFLMLATAQDISFFPASQDACNVPNFPCLGGIYCCPRPAVCIGSASGQFICVDAAGFPVNGGISGSIPNGGSISSSKTITSDTTGPIVGPTLPPVVVVPGNYGELLPGGESTTPLPHSSLTVPIPLPATTIPSSSTSILPLSKLIVPGSIGNNNGPVTPVL